MVSARSTSDPISKNISFTIASQDMSKSNSICVWDIVDNFIHTIQSQIDFNCQPTYLYDMQYYYKEDE